MKGESVGKFWRLFAPVSPSPASLGVTPPPTRSMPRSVFSKIVLGLLALPVQA